MGMIEIPGTLKAASIKMDADATGGGDSIGNKYSQKFSFVDSVPATDGLEYVDVYCYTIPMGDHTFYYAKMTLSGKDSGGEKAQKYMSYATPVDYTGGSINYYGF